MHEFLYKQRAKWHVPVFNATTINQEIEGQEFETSGKCQLAAAMMEATVAKGGKEMGVKLGEQRCRKKGRGPVSYGSYALCPVRAVHPVTGSFQTTAESSRGSGHMCAVCSQKIKIEKTLQPMPTKDSWP